jgi:desulfoferrodoxin-like iron-binding protein
LKKEKDMADRLQVYKCELCGNIVEVVHAGAGDLVCCGESMVLLEENTVDAAVENCDRKDRSRNQGDCG